MDKLCKRRYDCNVVKEKVKKSFFLQITLTDD